jgi:hypothetical protein
MYTVKSLHDVELDEEHRCLEVVEVFYRPLYVLEVVIDRSALDEHALAM